VAAVQETYEGMDSSNSPCSGFVTVGDDGVPCAGFRQCSSSHGATGLNPQAHAWDVPLELRCATDGANMTQWGPSEFILPFYYFRGLPYDPTRPWKDSDGKWYVAMSTDGCNASKARPCPAGGRLDLFTSPALRGADADWTQLLADEGGMFTTNMTVSGAVRSPGAITGEFVTSGYFGGLPGDPDGGRTRVVTQNRAGPTFWVGKQEAGGKFEALWDVPGAVGHYDYGSLTMARTLGSADANQVNVNGRRVLLGWIGGSVASQSLPRDLSLSPTHELLQAFVPELQVLRETQEPYAVLSGAPYDGAKATAQVEVVATFSFDAAKPPTPADKFGFAVLGNGDGATEVYIQCAGAADCTAHVDSTSQGGRLLSAPLPMLGNTSLSVHVIVDGSIVEAIFNNRTAFVNDHISPSNDDATTVSLLNADGVTGTASIWTLKQANNFP